MSHVTAKRATQLFSIIICLTVLGLSVFSVVGLVDEPYYARMVEADGDGDAGLDASANPSFWRYGDCYIFFYTKGAILHVGGSLDLETFLTPESLSGIGTDSEHFSSTMNNNGEVAYVLTDDDADTDFYFRYGDVDTSDCSINWDVSEQSQTLGTSYATGRAKFPTIDYDDEGHMWVSIQTGTTTPYQNEVWECVDSSCSSKLTVMGSSTQAMPGVIRGFSSGMALITYDIASTSWAISYTTDNGDTWSDDIPLPTNPSYANWHMFDTMVSGNTLYYVLRGSSGNNLFSTWYFGSGWPPTELDLGHAYLTDSTITTIEGDIVITFAGFGFEWSEDSGVTWNGPYEFPADMGADASIRTPRYMTNDRGAVAYGTGGDLFIGLFYIVKYWGTTGTTVGWVNWIYVGGHTRNESCSFELQPNKTYFVITNTAYESTVINATTMLKNVTSSVGTINLYLAVYRGTWEENENIVVTPSYPLVQRDIIMYSVANETTDRHLSWNPATTIKRFQPVAIAIGTPHDGVFVYCSPISPQMYQHAELMPTTMTTFLPVANEMYLFGILQYAEGAQYITTTVTANATSTTVVTSTSTITISPTTGTDLLPMLIVFGLLLLLPPLILGYLIGTGGVFLGLSLGLGIGVAIGALPFWMVILMTLGMIVTIVLRSRGIGNRGD